MNKDTKDDDASPVNRTRFYVDVHQGPRGTRLVAQRPGALVIAQSAWFPDLSAAWAALGELVTDASLASAIGSAVVPPRRMGTGRIR